MARDVDTLIRRAQLQARHQDIYGAIESLRQALTIDSDSASAHALLALLLRDQKRLYAAEHEVQAALALDPQSAFVHFAAANIATAQRRFHQAEDHLNAAAAIDPDDSAVLRALAHLYGLWNRPRDVMPLLERARDMDPGDAENWAALAGHCFKTREFARAEEFARRALQLEPENAAALLTMGHLLLKQGQSREAREHALMVLAGNANHEGAIQLLSAVKARQNIFLGLWWRFNSFFAGGSMTRRVTLLVGLYLAYRIALIAVKDEGHENAAPFINGVWLVFCVYTWIGPAMFMNQLRRELQPARLDSRY